MSDETKSLRQQFGNLVAAIHRDGGHRQHWIGHDKIADIVEDCICLIGNERAKADEQAAEIERLKEGDAYARRLFKIVAPQCEPLESPYGVISQIDNFIAGLESELAALKSAAEPVSVEERLPSSPGRYLVEWDFDGNLTWDTVDFDGDNFGFAPEPIRWMPLPPATDAVKEGDAT